MSQSAKKKFDFRRLTRWLYLTLALLMAPFLSFFIGAMTYGVLDELKIVSRDGVWLVVVVTSFIFGYFCLPLCAVILYSKWQNKGSVPFFKNASFLGFVIGIIFGIIHYSANMDNHTWQVIPACIFIAVCQALVAAILFNFLLFLEKICLQEKLSEE